MEEIANQAIQQELEKLLALLDQEESIKRYKELEARIADNERLQALVEEIKVAQKEAVNFAHYGKPEAEQEAIRRADELTQVFDEHPLVLAYREALVEANDLVQYVTRLIETRMNEELESGGEF